MSKNLFLGIDVHLKENTCCFLDSNGNQITNIFTFENNLQGAQMLENKIQDVMSSSDFDKVYIATESTSFLDFHLVDFLSKSPALSCYSPQVYQFNPKLISGFRSAYPDKDKTDKVDAFVIADRLRFGRLPEPYEEHQHYFPLKRLTRYRYHLVETITREKNYFLTHLFLKYSSYNTLKPFSNTFGKTSLAVIEEFFTPDELASTPLEELIQFVVSKGKNRFANPEQIAKDLQKVARESYRIRPALAKSVNLILSTTLQNIRVLSASLKQLDKAIEDEFRAFPNTLTSVVGLGPVYSAGIFAQIGNIKRFPKEEKLAKFAGLTWRKTSSGNFIAEITRMTKTGNQYLRYYLIEAANSLRVHNEEYKAYYQAKYKEVTRFQHKRALALTARKLVRLVFALLTKNQLYQERRPSASFII